MKKPLNVLIVEDSKDDTILLLRELEHHGYEPVHAQVETPEELQHELIHHPWDIVFSDFSMPHFNAFDALAMVRKSDLDIPFVIVSGTIGEDRAVIAMKAGAHDYILKGNLKRLGPAVERELRDARVRKERKQAEAIIHRLAYTDPVTELPNRTLFLELTQQAVEAARENGFPLALLFMDVDRFKDVNDTLGHSRGDQLLQKIGARLRSMVFSPDVIGRLGGDEFGILLPRLSAVDDVTLVIKKLQDFLQAPFMINEIPIAVEASFGVALLGDNKTNANDLLQQADIAMYRAKQMASGYTIYAPEHDPHSPERLGLLAELRDTIDKNRLLLHFQPKVDIQTSRVVGAEALVRWQHPIQGLIPPDKFISIAEHTGLITPLTKWVLTDALKSCHYLSDVGINLRMSVNLSARSLHDPHLPALIENTLKSTGTEPSQLTLEITESAIMLDPIRAEENLLMLSRMGIWLSIDDFGTGYTSFGSIKRLPVNEIKIDKSFVSDMLSDKKDNLIVRSVIELGRNFGLSVVAEGVETKEAYDALGAMGCDQAQGYFISRPQACDAMISWLPSTVWSIEPSTNSNGLASQKSDKTISGIKNIPKTIEQEKRELA